TYERDWDGYDRNQSRSPVPKEDEYDDGNQNEGISQSVHHLLNRSIQKLGYVITDFIINAGWKVARHFIELCFYIFDHIIGITAIILFEHDRSGWMSVQIGVDIKEFAPQLHFGDIL